MLSIQACPLPAEALLARYAHAGAFTDCYATTVGQSVTQARYVEAFYTGGVFRIERWILARTVAKASTDAQVRELAQGTASEFAAWRVEDRNAQQLLLSDMSGHTRSWLMTAPVPGGTRLYFGSAVVAAPDPRTGKARMGFVFQSLLGFHQVYSRVLLQAARDRLLRGLPAA